MSRAVYIPKEPPFFFSGFDLHIWPGGHAILFYKRILPKIQRNFGDKMVFTITFYSMLESVSLSPRITAFLMLVPKTPILAILVAIWQTSASSLSLTRDRYSWSLITATRFQAWVKNIKLPLLEFISWSKKAWKILVFWAFFELFLFLSGM